MLKELLSSKKFWIGFFGAVIWPLLIVFVPALEPMEEHITEIAGIIIGTVISFGASDFGKEAKKIL